MYKFKNKTFLVYGAGLSGSSAVSFIKNNGGIAYLYDDNKSLSQIQNFEDVKNLNIQTAILSPGVAVLGNKNIELLKKLNIPYESEFSFGIKNAKGKKICVTGTNGKTTTVNILYNLFKSQQKQVFLCGNTDTPITSVCDKTTDDCVLICEVSSFALETANNIEIDACAILNIEKDHISRHQTFENYSNEKYKLASFLKKDNLFVCEENFDTKNINSIIKKYSTKIYSNACAIEDWIYYEDKKILNKKSINLIGEKNLENILCAIIFAKYFGIKNKNIKKTIKNFKPLANRLQFVKKINNVTYINDSKATNPHSTLCALECFKDVVLLLGGSDKGYDFDDIFLSENLPKKIIAFGEVKEKIIACANRFNFQNIYQQDSMKNATQLARKMATSGEVVLLSPACASFDEFKSYKHRGECFCEIVNSFNAKGEM
ncbi:MAG: UDP-N-acetylmuramoyl-L-alanine--D-glutamate ligase [Clostridia bacterium]|nr:UDP-N-acetylmuramoyl-L-alanine--D-glutamate ligase [Clostridia bacterium]